MTTTTYKRLLIGKIGIEKLKLDDREVENETMIFTISLFSGLPSSDFYSLFNDILSNFFMAKSIIL